jgi:Na+-translocating ferredoxin:NAD+ oxidoreductase RnfG subunit
MLDKLNRKSFSSAGPRLSRLSISALALWLCLFSSVCLAGEKEFDPQVYLTKEQALAIAFPGADEIVKEKKWLTGEQKETIEKLCQQPIHENRITYYVGMKDKKPMGYMIIDHMVGKTFPITFMVVLNVDGTVREVEIMIYREPRGGEVRNKSFLDQFLGMNAGSEFRDIHSITGATLSVRAITRGVQKAVAAYQVLYSR